MKRQPHFEFLYQVAALVLAIVIVHLCYITVIRPNAAEIAAATAERVASGDTSPQAPSLWVVLKDYEQEACVILMFWSIAIMAFKGRAILQERKLLEQDLVRISEGMSVLPEDTREFVRVIEALPDESRDCLLSRTLLTALQRFASTRSVQDVSDAVRSVCDTESERLDSELSMVRYIAWAIPSIGFIGTVRGIGDALSQAYRAVEGDISGVTAALGVAFNSTFVALVISIVLMFLMHQLQLQQERLVLEVQTYADRKLLRHMQVRDV
jgi:biopolymer transport protein ExbB/TolQ